MNKFKRLKKSLDLTRNSYESGVTCLHSIIKYHGGTSSFQYLRTMSSVGTYECTLLSLMQTARKVGFDARGYKLDLSDLERIEHPCVLSTFRGNQHRFVIFLSMTTENQTTKYIIGDPIVGMVSLSEDEMENIWPSRTVLLLEPTVNFEVNLRGAKRRKIFSYLLENINLVLANTILSTVQICCFLFFSFLLLRGSKYWFFDVFDKKVLLGSGVLCAIYLLYQVVGFIRSNIAIVQAVAVENSLTKDLLHQIYSLSQPHLFFDIQKNLVLDFQLRSSVQAIFVKGFRDVIWFLATFVFLSFIAPQTLIFIFFVFIFYLAILKYSGKGAVWQLQKNEANASFLVVARELMKSLEAIHQLNKQRFFWRKLENCMKLFRFMFVKITQDSLKYELIMKGVLGCFFIVSVSWYLNRLVNNDISLSLFLIIVGNYACIYNALLSFFKQSAHMALLDDFLSRVNEIAYINDCSELGKIIAGEIEYIKVVGLGYSDIHQNKVFFSDFSCSLKKGEIIGIIGKTQENINVLGRIFMKQLDYSSGSVIINNCLELTVTSASSWNKIVVFVPQVPVIFTSTILENIAFEDAINDKPRVVQFVKEIGLDFFLSRFPKRGDTLIGEDGVVLSTMDQQLISIVRALYRRPELLILHEPFFFLNSDFAKFAFQKLKEYGTSTSVMFLTSDSSFPHDYSVKVYHI